MGNMCKQNNNINIPWKNRTGHVDLIPYKYYSSAKCLVALLTRLFEWLIE